MVDKKKVFLLDAFALIFRGYYALIKNPRINSKGMDTSAVLGFMNSLLEIIRKEKPDLIAVAFDKGGSVARKEAFAEYKSNRLATPEAIKIAVPIIHEILKAMNIPIIEVAGYEADDLIGTVAKQAEKEDYQVFMVTPDKDYAQLISENIFMYKPARMGNGIEIWDIEKVKEKFEVENTLQVIDYLGMMGDAVDNIPGLPGVGDKTAKKFLKQYGSMENLLANTADLKGKMKEKIEANKDLGILSKQLATIMLDCPVEFDAEAYKRQDPDFGKVEDLFADLEFNRMQQTILKIYGKVEATTKSTGKKQVKSSSQGPDLFSMAEDDNQISTAKDDGNFHQYMDNSMANGLLLAKLLKQDLVSVYMEPEVDTNACGISFSFGDSISYTVILPKGEEEEVLKDFRPFLENENIRKVSYDIKTVYKKLQSFGIELKGIYFDTLLAHYLINADMRHGLNLISENKLSYKLLDKDEFFGKKKKHFEGANSKDLARYLGERAGVNYRVYEKLEQELKDNGLYKLYSEIEMPLIEVLADMEIEGIRVDVSKLTKLSAELEIDILSLEKSIYELSGEDFNIASPKQLGVVLFEKMQLVEKPKKTKTGQYATGEEVLSKLVKKHSIVEKIMEWRGLVKLKNTYVDSLPKDVNEKTGRIHTTYSQAVAATGRLSSNNPNLQNIPIRTARGKKIREAFVSKDENYTLLAADYSQIELRLIAQLSGDEQMMKAFIDDKDIHAQTAAEIYKVPIEEVTREQRGNAKTVNFGIIYGVSAIGLSQQTDMSRTEAKKMIESYYETYPTLKEFMAKQVEFAQQNSYVETLLGRKRYLRNINSSNSIVRSADERNAVNMPVQGTAADIIKIAMIDIYKILKKGNYKTKMLLQVHDELVFDMHKDEKEELTTIIKDSMEKAYEINVPLRVDIGEGDNWLQAH